MNFEKFLIVIVIAAMVAVVASKFQRFRRELALETPRSEVASVEEAQRVIARLHIFRKSVLRQSQEALFHARQRCAAGRARFLDVLEAQRTVNGARRQYIKALAYQESAIRVITSFGMSSEFSAKR